MAAATSVRDAPCHLLRCRADRVPLVRSPIASRARRPGALARRSLPRVRGLHAWRRWCRPFGRLRYWLHPFQAPRCRTGFVASKDPKSAAGPAWSVDHDEPWARSGRPNGSGFGPRGRARSRTLQLAMRGRLILAGCATRSACLKRPRTRQVSQRPSAERTLRDSHDTTPARSARADRFTGVGVASRRSHVGTRVSARARPRMSGVACRQSPFGARKRAHPWPDPTRERPPQRHRTAAKRLLACASAVAWAPMRRPRPPPPT